MLGFCHVKEKMVKNKNKSNNSRSGFMLHGRASQGTLSWPDSGSVKKPTSAPGSSFLIIISSSNNSSILTFIWKAERDRERKRERFSHPLVTPQMATMARARPVQNQELHLALPCGWQVCKHLVHFLLLSQAQNRELDYRWSNWDSNQHPYVIPALQTVA